jgi:hypothetical protein
MAQRALILKLPNTVREDLDQRLLASAFSGYDELSDWLASQGHVISKSSVHRYGVKLERRLQSLRAPVTPVQRIDQAMEREASRVQHAKVRQETGVFVLVIDPPTRETTLYATMHSAAHVQTLIEEALFGARARR